MSENIEKTLRRVEKCNAQGKYEASIELLKPLIQDYPENIQLINIMGASCDMADKKFMAVTYFHKSADYYFQKRFYDKALAVYKKILKIQPDDARSYECSAKIYEVNGNFSEAALNYKSSANKYYIDGNKEKSINLLQEAVKLAPFDQRLKLDLIDMYKKIGETAKAIDLYLDFAEGFSVKGDFAGARTILENILKLDSENVKALQQLAFVAEKLGDKEQTLAARQKLLSFDPNNTDALAAFAMEYYKRFGDTENSVNMLKKAHRLQPENMNILLNLKEISPNDLEVRQALKVFYLEHGDKKSAVHEILGMADLFEQSKNKSMADKLRLKANEMLREIDYATQTPTPSVGVGASERIVSLDSLASNRLSDKKQQESDETNPYFAELLKKNNNKPATEPSGPSAELKPPVVSRTEPPKAERKPAPPADQPAIQIIKQVKKTPVPSSGIPAPAKTASVASTEIPSKIHEQKMSTVVSAAPATDVGTKSEQKVRSDYRTTKEQQIMPSQIQNTVEEEKTISKVKEPVNTEKGIASDSVKTSPSAIKHEEEQKEQAESIFIDDVDIDPDTLTIKVKTVQIDHSTIKAPAESKDTTIQNPAEKTEVKTQEKKENIIQKAPVEEHKDVSELVNKLPDEHHLRKEESANKFVELQPELTKEILVTEQKNLDSKKESSIPPPKFIKDRMNIKVVQLSNDNPLISSGQKLSAKDDSPEIFLQVADIDEIERSSYPQGKMKSQAVSEQAQVKKSDLRILEQTTPVVQETEGFDVRNVLKDVKISDTAKLPSPGDKKLFSDNTANLSLQMNSIFNSMIGDSSLASVEDDETRFNLGLSYMEMGLYDDAIPEFLAVAEKKDFATRCARFLALAYSHKQNNVEAVKWYLKISNMFPAGSEENLDALFSAGDLCLALNDYNNAQKYLMEVYQKNPSYHGLMEKLEFINSKNRKREEA